MAAVIQRVVSSPSAHVEYLARNGTWGARKAARIFPTHGLADEIAAKLREEAHAHNQAAGRIDFAFVHARTVESHELNDFALKMDPRRAAEVRRDPVEAYS